MLKYILLGLAVVIVLFLIVAALRPGDFIITRSARIPAPAPVVFEQINDLHKWNNWSPWSKMDPAAKQTFEGPEAGVGSSYAWVGNSKVGEGKMTITESKPTERVQMRLEFLKPMAATNMAEFKVTPEGNETSVVWTMTGRNGFMGRAVSMLMDVDKMVGGQFEEGLENLKAVVAPKAS